MKWQVGRPCLKYDEEKGMICEWCLENKQDFGHTECHNSTRFINGCTSYKMESISS